MKKSIIVVLLNVLAVVLLTASVLFVTSCKSKVVYGMYLSSDEYSTVKVKAGSEYVLPTPTRDGYEFDGWYSSPDYSGEALTVIKSKDDVTLYAKWSRLYNVSLELNGGTLSVSSLKVKEGADLSEYMKNYIPEKQGLKGVWFYNGEKLSSGRTVSADLTLSAKYEVSYTVELREAKDDGSYTVISSERKTGYLGDKVVSDERIKGYEEKDTADTVTSIASLSANASQNNIVRYFTRESFTVSFYSNDGAADRRIAVNALYGEEITVPYDLTYEGRYLAGWAKSRTGSVEYSVNYIDTLIYNKTEGATYEVEADSFVVESSVSLYAVWVKAYVDMFGGSDYVILPDENGTDIYLSRDELFFKGTYYAESKEFVFKPEGKRITGTILGNGLFAYETESKPSAMLLYVDKEDGVRIDYQTTVMFEGYNVIEYRTVDENGTSHKSSGTYVIDGDDYVVTFTSGDMSGKTEYFKFGSYGETSVFSVRDTESYEMGKLVQFKRENKNFVVDGTGNTAYYVTLDGYGNALYDTADGEINLRYYIDKENGNTIILFDNAGAVVGHLRVYESRTVDGIVKGYLFYNEVVDGEYELPDGATLSLDGVFGATYTKGGRSVSGEFTVRESVFGGYIVAFDGTSEKQTFFIEEITEGDDVVQGEVEYSINYKADGYAEYYYSDENSIYYAPMLVINDTEEGHASVYGYTSDREYVKVSEGGYVSDGNGNYVFTADEEKINKDTNAVTSPINIARVRSFVFGTGETANGVSVNYWYSQTTIGGVTRNYGVEYTSSEGETLKLIGGFAEYAKGTERQIGAYALEDGVVSVDANDLYFELTGETTFRKLNFKPYTAYSVSDRNILVNEYIENKLGSLGNEKVEELDFDGSDGATYRKINVVNGVEVVEEEIEGTVSVADKTTSNGYPVYSFVSGTLTFEYIRLSSTDGTEYFGKNDGYGKTYRSDGALTLDGYGFEATYTNGNTVYEGQYIVIGEGLILLLTEESEFIFALGTDDFEIRGNEYGSYVVVDNWNDNGVYLDLDGNNNAVVYTINDAHEKIIIDAEGVYDRTGDLLTVEYKDGISEVTLSGDTAMYNFSMDGESVTGAVFVKVREGVVKTYINKEDWSIIKLDNLGGAKKTDKYGVEHQGRYILISDDLLYYEYEEDSLVYSYDSANGTVKPIDYSRTRYSYYSADLDTIVFTEYGFAVFNGTERYYYNVEDRKVYIYKPDASAGDYGFVKEQFGTGNFDKTIENYGETGITYLKSTGYEVVFKREQETSGLYPYVAADGNRYVLEDLVFAPNSGESFVSAGKVTVNGEVKSCTVTGRRKGGQLYLTVSVEAFNYEISVTYKGEDSMQESLSTY
ncbi:MAG: InlB B-repeat-containing protein, partial [Clostridia bacterium]|nr:InlB B-repeat-containing protein [Clostridia bacterium]